jgi:hypothetical protein
MTLSSITRTGATPLPPRILLYGPPKVGKSTFGASAPNPVFIQIEDGLDALNVNAFPMAKTYPQVTQQVQTLISEPHEFQTLVIDSLDWLEKLVWAQVIVEANDAGIKNIEDFGYGKGYVKALDQWRNLLAGLNILRETKRMGIILIAHAAVKRFDAPDKTAGYDRYQPKLHTAAWNLVTEASDIIGFACKDVTVVEVKDGLKKKMRGIGNGDSVLKLTERPGFIAGNRYSLPDSIPLEWDAFAQAFAAARAAAQQPQVAA